MPRATAPQPPQRHELLQATDPPCLYANHRRTLLLPGAAARNVGEEHDGSRTVVEPRRPPSLPDRIYDVECLAQGPEHCFRIVTLPDSSFRMFVHETLDGGQTWMPSWHPAPRYRSGAGACPSLLAAEPLSGTLVLSVADAGVVVRDDDARWTHHAVGQADLGPLPPPFSPQSTSMLVAWSLGGRRWGLGLALREIVHRPIEGGSVPELERRVLTCGVRSVGLA